MTNAPEEAPMSLADDLRAAPNDGTIPCVRCGGSGVGHYADAYQPWNEECAGCGGSGLNWRYPGGAIAQYYSGPLIGRDRAIAAAQFQETK